MRMSGPVVLGLTRDDGHVPSRSCVGFVAAAVSMPMGGCRARRSLVVVDVVSVTVELTVL